MSAVQPQYTDYGHTPPAAPQSYMRRQDAAIPLHHQAHLAAPGQGPSPSSEPMYMPPSELVALGLASRDSRIGERWTEFMQQSGFLDEYSHQHR